MKSIIYKICGRPRNFDDLEDYCGKNEVPERVSIKKITRNRNMLTLIGCFSYEEIYLKYKFAGEKNFSFKKFYSCLEGGKLDFYFQPKEDFSLLKELGIKGQFE